MPISLVMLQFFYYQIILCHLTDDKKALFHKEKGFCIIYKKLLS